MRFVQSALRQMTFHDEKRTMKVFMCMLEVLRKIYEVPFIVTMQQ